MAERTILVCDVCGEPAAKTVTLKIGNRTLLKDLCERHFAELTTGARQPKRGRKPGVRKTASEPAKRAAKSAKRGATAGRTRRLRRRTAAAEAEAASA